MMAAWTKLGLVFSAFGFLMVLLAMNQSDDSVVWQSTDDAIEACIIISFLMYGGTFMGLIFYHFADEPIKGHKVVLIGNIVAAFLAGKNICTQNPNY